MKRVFIIFLLFAGFYLYAQDQSFFWEDGGSTGFLKTRADANGGVLIGETITLQPQMREIDHSYQFNEFSSGVDWVWPFETMSAFQNGNLAFVEDVDFIGDEDQELYLITDRNNQNVIIYNPENELDQRIVWVFNKAEYTLPVDAGYYQKNNDNKVLITYPFENKIVQVDAIGRNVDWFYGDGTEGAGNNQLDEPADATFLPDSSEYLIADAGNKRIIIVDESKNVVWEFTSDSLLSPVDVEYDNINQRVLVTDEDNHWVFWVDRATQNIETVFGTVGHADSLSFGLNKPIDSDIVDEQTILISDAGNERIIQVSNSEITWTFPGKIQGLKDADPLENGKILAVKTVKVDDNTLKYLPVILGFESQWVTSDIYTLPSSDEFNTVVFDSIQWNLSQTDANTDSIQFQFRASINNLAIDTDVEWIDPVNSIEFNNGAFTGLLPNNTFGKYYQFKALLTASSPTKAVEVENIKVYYHYYNKKHDVNPHFYSQAFGIDAQDPDSVLIRWEKISYKFDLPDREDLTNLDAVLDLRFDINENNPEEGKYGKVVSNLHASFVDTTGEISLENQDQLKGVRSFILHGYPSTENSSVTPELVKWRVDYYKVNKEDSRLYFVNEQKDNVEGYSGVQLPKADDEKINNVHLKLYDQNLGGNIKINITSESGDTEQSILYYQPEEYFFNTSGIPVVISSQVTPNNGTLEVSDRQTITATYVDLSDSTDVSSATAIVVAATPGELSVSNKNGAALANGNEIQFGEIISVTVTDEDDKNLNPQEMDSLYVYFEQEATGDMERLVLYEQAANSQYNTGTFTNSKGIVIQNGANNDIIHNDGILHCYGGNEMRIYYDDNVGYTVSLFIPITTPPDTLINLNGKTYITEVAPNPFYENKGQTFKLRVASETGELDVHKIDIFNIAAERVRTIDANELYFTSGGQSIRVKLVENWWDLTNDSGEPVSSGTYFVQVKATLTNDDTGNKQDVTIMKKIVVIR